MMPFNFLVALRSALKVELPTMDSTQQTLDQLHMEVLTTGFAVDHALDRCNAAYHRKVVLGEWSALYAAYLAAVAVHEAALDRYSAALTPGSVPRRACVRLGFG
jgi:hypothetical protein